ncbi:MAG: DUF2058 family protein [Myxococcaceae bacterium]|nr:DUF2058 family protein [Myxococcaceae bacterium]
MQSLKDKLLKAGLVTEADAARASSSPQSSNAKREGAIPKLPPLPGSPAAQREASRAQLELDRQIRSRVLEVQVPVDAGATTFYFVTRKNKARRLDLSEAQAKRLEAGELAVVERPDPGQIEHALVPAAVAVELHKLSEKVVRFLNHSDVKIGFDAE